MKRKMFPGQSAGRLLFRAYTIRIGIIRRLLAFCLILLVPAISFAADIISAQSGSWTSSATWVGGVVPAQTDNVTIKSGHSVTIPSSGTKTCTNLTVENGGHLYANAGGTPRYMDIYGNISCDGTIGNGSTFDAISFNIEAAACTISGSGVFDAARIRKNAGLNPETTLEVAMNINLRYAGTAIFNNKSTSNFHIIIDAGYTLNCTGNAGTYGNVCIDGSNGSNGSTYGGSVTVNGTLIVSGILYLTTDNNSGAYSVSFTVNNGGIVNTSSVVCSNSGTAGHTTTISDGGKLNFTSGDWGTIGTINNTYVLGTASIIEYSGNGDGTQIVGNPAAYGHLVISGTGEKTLAAEEIIVNSDLIIQGGASLAVPPSGSLTVQGNVNLNSPECLILKAGNGTSAPGSFIANGSFSGTGTALIEKFIPRYNTPDDPNYHLISSPVLSQNIQPGFVTDPPESSTDFYRWDEISGTWVNSKNSAGLWNTSFQPGDDRTFNAGRGYLVAYDSDVVKSFSGNMWNSGLDVPLTYTPGNYAGYNLTGNPFTSALTGDIQNWAKSAVQNAIWVWDPSAGNYLTWNGLTGTLTDGVIPSMQGFFVKASGNSPSLTIPASSRIHHARAGYKSKLQNTIGITLSGNTWSDEVILYIPAPSYGMPDSLFNLKKLFGYRDSPQLYFIHESGLFSIIQSDTTSREWVMPLGIQKGSSDSLRFEFTGIDSFPGNDAVYLEDRLEGVTTALREERLYDFISSLPEENDRFFLHYRNTTGINTANPLSRTIVFSSGGTLMIGNPENSMAPEKFEIYDMIGRMVLAGIIPSGIRKIDLDLASGYYMVRLSTGHTSITRKILLNK
jgi:hypothetical protein